MMRLATCLLAAAGTLLPAQQRPAAAPAAAALLTADRWERAVTAWDEGRYDTALLELRRVLAAPNAADFHERVAELTGERWQTVQVAEDARAPRWSPDGSALAYEMGTGAQRRFRVVRASAPFPTIAEGPGAAPSFAPDGGSMAWVEVPAGGRAQVRWKRGEATTETIPLDAEAATAATLFGGTALQLAVLTGTAGENTATLNVLQLAGGDRTWRTVELPGGGQPVDLVRSPDGSRVLVLIGERGAFARGGGSFAGAARVTAFAELSTLGTGVRVAGFAPAFSRDGSTLAWMEGGDDGEQRIVVRRGAAEPVVAHRTRQPLAGLALSPDGAQVAFQQMLREDWELFTAPSGGGADPARLTREIQHDLLPQFLSPTRVLAVMGEARHRRSHLYDLTTGTRTRLFHNNSVRTVAPEYEWAPSPDGTRVAIVAERDGDTVTPHRHLWLMDLSAPVTPEQLKARVDSNLAAEQALRAAGRRMFAPIATSVAAATAEVSVGRIYGYERDLFGFDSKHITRPGNWKATNYLLERYRSFGLDAHLQPFKTLAGTELDVANVVATIKGTVNPELVYVVGAHFDSHMSGPGADDNTSGTAMLLEAARVLARRPLPATVMFVAFTGEESGLRGAREFGRRMKDSIRVVGALNNDMMGYANDFRLDNTIRYSNPGLRDVQHAAAIQFSRLVTYDAYYYKSTDAHALYDAWGDIIAGIGSYPILGNPHYHQPHDVLETINHHLLAEVSRTTVATIMLMASSPSRLAGLEAKGTAASWAPAVEKGIVRYLVRWGPAEDPMRYSAAVTGTRATLVGAKPGWKVAVKAVNARGLEGWDWARADVQ